MILKSIAIGFTVVYFVLVLIAYYTHQMIANEEMAKKHKKNVRTLILLGVMLGFMWVVYL